MMTTVQGTETRGILRETAGSLRASPVFAFYLVVTLVVAGIIGLITLNVIDLGMTHFGDVSHRTHDITYGLLFSTVVVGVLAQLRRPLSNIAGMVMALIPPAGLLLAALLSGDLNTVWRFNPLGNVAALTLVAALVHPAGCSFFASFRIARLTWAMVALVAVAAVPLLQFASTNIDLQRTQGGTHGGMGHYGFMAAWSFTVIGVGLLASLRPVGWRLPAWAAGLLPVLLGMVSLLNPGIASSLSTLWAAAAIVWGMAFIAVAELTRSRDISTMADSPDPAGIEVPADHTQ